MTDVLLIIGSALAISGSILSIWGTLINNLYLNHRGAMMVWSIANPIMAVWSTGFWLGFWNGGLSGLSLVVMYSVFTVTNWYGLMKGNK